MYNGGGGAPRGNETQRAHWNHIPRHVALRRLRRLRRATAERRRQQTRIRLNTIAAVTNETTPGPPSRVSLR